MLPRSHIRPDENPTMSYDRYTAERDSLRGPSLAAPVGKSGFKSGRPTPHAKAGMLIVVAHK
jgi:hypothetical protein